MGNPNIQKSAVRFSKTYQPSRASRKKAGKKKTATIKKRRELTKILSLALKGKFGEEINTTLFNGLGLKATSLEEALHFVQIAKAISKEDTQAYQALMQTSGLNKPEKSEIKVSSAADPKQFDTIVKKLNEIRSRRG